MKCKHDAPDVRQKRVWGDGARRARPDPCSVPLGAGPTVGRGPGLGLTQHRGRDHPRGLTRVAEADLNFDESIGAQARAHREGHAGMDDLEVRHLESLAATGDFAPGGEAGRAKLDAEGRAGLGGRNDDDGGLNLKHEKLLKLREPAQRPGRIPGVDIFSAIEKLGSGDLDHCLCILPGAGFVTRRSQEMRRQCDRIGRADLVSGAGAVAPGLGRRHVGCDRRGSVMATGHLTKSGYLAGLQCSRRLWRLVHEPPAYDDQAGSARRDAAREMGLGARTLFAGGVAIDDEAGDHAAAMRRTARLVADPDVPAIFGGAFEHDGARVRVDVLERLHGGSWGMRQVKSGTRVKEHHGDELALAAHVLNGAGIALSSVEILHVNTAYVRGSEGILWRQFFARSDESAKVAAMLADLPARCVAMWDCVAAGAMPDAEPGPQCGTPYHCEFWDDCTAAKPVDWIAHLPRLSASKAAELKAMGIEAISQIPKDFALTARQEVIRDVTVSGRPYVSPDLPKLLRQFAPPACFLDFEAMMPPVPLYAGTRPYQVLPFQWSLHAIDSAGVLHHREFLAQGDDDPRRDFARTLIRALDEFRGPVIVYSPYEQTRLKELAVAFPDLRAKINKVIARLLDLLPIVRSAVYYPKFQFSNSIKFVAPALAPGFGYDDLVGIADGMAALDAFQRLASGSVSDPDEIEQLRAALLAYCCRDTLAMVEVHRALLRHAES